MPRRMPDQRARTITLPATRLPRPSRFQPPPAVAEAAVGGDHVWVPTDEDAFRVAGAAVAAHLIAVRFHQDPGVRVACEPVPRDQDFGRVLDVHAERVAPERAPHDSEPARPEDANAVPVGSGIVVARAVADHAVGGLSDHEAEVLIPRGGEAKYPGCGVPSQ